jgi:hypothetical protein
VNVTAAAQVLDASQGGNMPIAVAEIEPLYIDPRAEQSRITGLVFPNDRRPLTPQRAEISLMTERGTGSRSR